MDLAAAAPQLVGDEIFLTGQVCSSLTRVIVSKHRHDELVGHVAALAAGPPDALLGPWPRPGPGPAAVVRLQALLQEQEGLDTGLVDPPVQGPVRGHAPHPSFHTTHTHTI